MASRMNFGGSLRNSWRRLNEQYEPYVRQHLAEVYLILGGTTASAAMGTTLYMNEKVDLGVMAALLSLIMVLGLHFYKDDGKNYYTRLGMLFTFGFCSGQTLGPMISYIAMVSPSVILTALLGTTVTFLSLSLAALAAERGKYLYLGGVLVSVINTMAVLSLCNVLFRSNQIQMIQLYVGVFVMAGFIIYDTQNIIEKRRMGNQDVIQHALDLFFDILSMFRRLLIILAQKEQHKSKDNEERKR